MSAELPIKHDDRLRANHRLLNALTQLWDEHPYMRFGQLVMNLSREPGGFADTWEWKHGVWLERITESYYNWSVEPPLAAAPSSPEQERNSE